MKYILLIIILVVPFSSQLKRRAEPGVETNPTKTEEAVKQAEKEYMDAYLNKDMAVVNRLLADDYLSTNAHGVISSKQDVLNFLRSGEVRYESLNSNEVRVRIYGDTALVFSRLVSLRRYQGQDYIQRDRHISVYVWREDRWLRVAAQSTSIREG